jgi:phosphoribosylanthranilate isomerase
MDGMNHAAPRTSRGTKVKICGVTSVADAELAVSEGAWAIGLVFYPQSPRRCERETAVEIGTTLKRRIELVGVFVNAPLAELVTISDETGITTLQLHGEEGPSYCEEVRRRTGLKVIKATRVRDAASVRALSAYRTEYHMLDAYVPGRPGGTGERFDWSLAAHHPGDPPLILSGGIQPENAEEAIRTATPFAIDVSSGVEREPGRKDPEKLRRLFAAVGEASPVGA